MRSGLTEGGKSLALCVMADSHLRLLHISLGRVDAPWVLTISETGEHLLMLVRMS